MVRVPSIIYNCIVIVVICYVCVCYVGRLDKTKGAIALRMRWYGTGIPQIVFVVRSNILIPNLHRMYIFFHAGFLLSLRRERLTERVGLVS